MKRNYFTTDFRVYCHKTCMMNSQHFPSLRRSNLLSYAGIASSAFGLLAMTFLLTSCASLNVSAPLELTAVQTETPLPSPTIVWFPPSATSSPQVFATSTATPEMRPGLGDVTVTDDFSDPKLWDIARSDQGSSALNANNLTLAVQPGFYFRSLRHGLTLGNFYAEITASPSLCRGKDSYGLLVRANAVAYYRFSLSCEGKTSAERISTGTREVLQSPIPSGDVPGAPGQVRIGIWAVGQEMRLFLNGRYQFTIANSNYPTGTVGAFVNAAGKTAVVVNFSDLQIQEVNYSLPTKTPRP
jgi:hypothetical protein